MFVLCHCFVLNLVRDRIQVRGTQGVNGCVLTMTLYNNVSIGKHQHFTVVVLVISLSEVIIKLEKTHCYGVVVLVNPTWSNVKYATEVT